MIFKVCVYFQREVEHLKASELRKYFTCIDRAVLPMNKGGSQAIKDKLSYINCQIADILIVCIGVFATQAVHSFMLTLISMLRLNAFAILRYI